MVTKILNTDYFCLINTVCCSGVTDRREEGRFGFPGKLNVKPRPHLAYISALVGYCCIVFLSSFAFFGVFSVDLGF